MKDMNNDGAQRVRKHTEFSIQYVLMTKTFNKLDIEETCLKHKKGHI